MGKLTIAGVVITLVVFIALAGVISSQITVAGATVGVPGLPDAEPISLLDAILAWLKGLIF